MKIAKEAVPMYVVYINVHILERILKSLKYFVLHASYCQESSCSKNL